MATYHRPVGAKIGEPGKKCRLPIDRAIPISQGGTDEEHNLRTDGHG